MNHQQLAWMGNETKFGYPSIRENNPFDILGIPKASSYQTVKRMFVELALRHHPDQNNGEGEVEEFIRLRQAFEAIRENADGTVRLTKDGDSSMTDDEFHAWFYEETGHNDIQFRMDLSTRKKVIKVANSQSQGGLDRGGMWEMARAMEEQEKILKNEKGGFKTTAKVESGSNAERNSRRRRRK